MHKNSDGRWIVWGRITDRVGVVVTAKDALNFFAEIIVEQNSGHNGMLELSPEKRAPIDALTNIIIHDMDDVAAVREANRVLATTLKVAEFRKWLPELLREFGRTARKEK